MPKAFAILAIFLPILPIPKIPNLVPVNCFPIKKSAAHFQFETFAASMPSGALLHAPKINKIPISAVASVKTSGVFVTMIFFFFAASKSIFPNPTAKFDSILTLSGNLFIVSASNLSVRADKIPSQPTLSCINFS